MPPPVSFYPPAPALPRHPHSGAPGHSGTVCHGQKHRTPHRMAYYPVATASDATGDGRHADARRGLCHGVCEVMAGVSPGGGVSVVAPRHIVGIQLQRAADCIVGDDIEHGLGLVHVGLHDGGGIFYPPALDGGGHE